MASGRPQREVSLGRMSSETRCWRDSGGLLARGGGGKGQGSTKARKARVRERGRGTEGESSTVDCRYRQEARTRAAPASVFRVTRRRDSDLGGWEHIGA